MAHPARSSIRRAFHNDTCKIYPAVDAGDGVWDPVLMQYTFTEDRAVYEGECVLDERSGVRVSDEQAGRLMIQGAEIRIECLPSEVAVGMYVAIDRITGRVWEIREISEGTNELTSTLLVQDVSQIPAREQ